MAQVIFATGNADKVRSAKIVCEPFGIKITQHSLEIDEIQSEDPERIARNKAAKAFALLSEPLVINDDSWSFPGLRGFPGPYMKDMNHWFTAEDFLRLTLPLTDRRVIMRQFTIIQDKDGQQLFQRDVQGILLKEIRGEHPTSPNLTIVSQDGGNHSVAEIIAAGQSGSVSSGQRTTWHDFAEWYSKAHL